MTTPDAPTITARTEKGRTNVVTVGDRLVLGIYARYVTSSAGSSAGMLTGVHVDEETARNLMAALVEHFTDEG